MIQSKCPACDGYGTRPSRKTPGKFVTCRACGKTGLVAGVTLPIPIHDPVVQPIYIGPPIEPIPLDPMNPWGPVITCDAHASGAVSFGGTGVARS